MKLYKNPFIDYNLPLSEHEVEMIEGDKVEPARNFIGQEIVLTKIAEVVKEYKGKEESANVYITEDGHMFLSSSKSLSEIGNTLLKNSEGRAKVRLAQRLSKAGRQYYIFEEVKKIEENN